ncbi:MAG: cupin domain-containing protein [Xanthobacteraceae bacterium]|nr:cupin domain-containing protein [Xanthobacteraceae bacterium]
MKNMARKLTSIVASLFLLAVPGISPLRAEGPAPKPAAASLVVVKPILSASATSSGQPIVLPQKDVQVIASTYDIAPGAVLPRHKHPFPRYAYVLAGTLQVTNDDIGKTETYRQGDFILEAVGQWHHAVNDGPEAVKLMVIDMVEKGKPNVILQK